VSSLKTRLLPLLGRYERLSWKSGAGSWTAVLELSAMTLIRSLYIFA
jgi:hypothetical protein